MPNPKPKETKAKFNSYNTDKNPLDKDEIFYLLLAQFP
jgi:hypothetical protein